MKTLVEKFLESYKFIESEDSDKIYAIIIRYDNAEWYDVAAVIRQPTLVKIAKEWYDFVSYGPDDVTNILLYEVTPEEADRLEEITKRDGEHPSSSSDPDFQYLDDFFESHSEITCLTDAYTDYFLEDDPGFKDWVETWYYDQTDDDAPSVEEYIEDLLNRDSDDSERQYREVRYYISILEELNLDIPFGDFDL